ncbi:MAG: APC family permease [Candidatus Latescibacterota bacterium]
MDDKAPEPPGAPGGSPPLSDEPPPLGDRLKQLVLGKPRDLADRSLFHRLSLVPFLAWVGLGADGLSSSSYGPMEAFLTLREHTYLAVGLAALTALTVMIIAAVYSHIIEEFPQGGGGYLVASKLLGERWGVLSGSALLIDYVMTITVSIAAAGDALFSLLPLPWHPLKLPFEVLCILGLTTLNIRGVRESVIALLPVFLLFLVTHVLIIGGGILGHASQLTTTASHAAQGFEGGLATLGAWGMVLLFLHAYSLGGGTYTGLEAVSNGMPIMREPRVKTGQRTMVYMSTSLALCAGVLLVCYLLWNVSAAEGKTLNAVLTEKMVAGIPFGGAFLIATLISEGALLVAGAQAGFIDGPRVLANMAVDSWVPRRFAALSERLTTGNGIVLMGGAALVALLCTGGQVSQLVVMYSINVFLTFSLSMFGMARSQAHKRAGGRRWRRRLALFLLGFLLCVTILIITSVEKFAEGGWITLVATGAVVSLCFAIRDHYRKVGAKVSELYAQLGSVPIKAGTPHAAPDPAQPTAVVLVAAYGGLGIHTVLNIFRAFPGHFKNLVFVSVGVVDSGGFKGEDAIDLLRTRTEEALRKYVALADGLGLPAEYRYAVGTDAVDEAAKLCRQIATEFHGATFFAGKVIFEREKWYQRLLHNETAYLIQKQLQWAGLTMVILPAKLR